MTIQVSTVFMKGVALKCPLPLETIAELTSYIVGFYESLFAGAEVRYPVSEAEFVYRVLKDGYDLEEVVRDSNAVVFDLDAGIKPSANLKEQHPHFHDIHAWRLMTTTFGSLI